MIRLFLIHIHLRNIIRSLFRSLIPSEIKIHSSILRSIDSATNSIQALSMDSLKDLSDNIKLNLYSPEQLRNVDIQDDDSTVASNYIYIYVQGY